MLYTYYPPICKMSFSALDAVCMLHTTVLPTVPMNGHVPTSRLAGAFLQSQDCTNFAGIDPGCQCHALICKSCSVALATSLLINFHVQSSIAALPSVTCQIPVAGLFQSSQSIAISLMLQADWC